MSRATFRSLMLRDLSLTLRCTPTVTPLVFLDEKPKPLKCGISDDLLARWPDNADSAKVQRWLVMWTRCRLYLTAIAQGGVRHDLDGNVAGEIDDAHRAHALRVLSNTPKPKPQPASLLPKTKPTAPSLLHEPKRPTLSLPGFKRAAS